MNNSRFKRLRIVIALKSPSRVSLQRLRQYDQRFRQILLFQDVGHTNLVLAQSRRGIETRGGRHHDGLPLVLELIQAPRAKLVRVVHRESRHGIESTHRNGGIATRYAVQPIDQEFTTLHILIVHGQHIIVRGIQGGLGDNLTDQRRALLIYKSILLLDQVFQIAR